MKLVGIYRIALADGRCRVTTPETRAKLSTAGKGHLVSAETRAKMSRTMKATLAAKKARAAA